MSLGTPIRRRSRDSGCQWLVIGMSLGVGCSLVFCLASYVLGIVEIQGLDRASSTSPAAVIIATEITATPAEATATQTESASPDQPETQEAAQATPESTAADIPTFTPTATLLNSGTTPTTLPESSQNTAATDGQSAASTEPTPLPDGEIGTPVPLSGEPTRTPAIGTGEGVPEVLAAVASPLVEIPGGPFTMGTTREEGLAAVEACVVRDGGNCTEAWIQDSTPAHEVTIDDFQIEIYEVSVTQYVTFLNYLVTQNPGTRVDLVGCGGQPCVLTVDQEPGSIIRYNGTDYEIVNPTFYANHPAFYVTWWGADAYCRALGRRLPTEAEWERAARGPANSIYPWGPEWLPTNANTSRSDSETGGTQPVDAYPNGVSVYGPYNMAGNVAEWVADFYQENYYSLPAAAGPNPRGPVNSDRRVARGGGWDNVPLFARTMHRMDVDPKQPRASLGFRCAADPGVQ